MKHKLFFNLCIFLLFFTLHSNAFNAPSVRIAPGKIYVGGYSRTGSFTVINPNERPIDISLSVENDKEAKYSEKDMIYVTPKSFTLKPQSAQEIRFKIRKKKGLENADYFSLISILSKFLHHQEKVGVKTSDSKVVSLGVDVEYNFKMPVVLAYGRGRRDAEIYDHNITNKNALRLNVLAKNTSNKFFYGMAKLSLSGKNDKTFVSSKRMCKPLQECSYRIDLKDEDLAMLKSASNLEYSINELDFMSPTKEKGIITKKSLDPAKL